MCNKKPGSIGFSSETIPEAGFQKLHVLVISKLYTKHRTCIAGTFDEYKMNKSTLDLNLNCSSEKYTGNLKSFNLYQYVQCISICKHLTKYSWYEILNGDLTLIKCELT